MNHPTSGGSYRREMDGSLTRIDALAAARIETPADAPASIERPAELSTDTETPPSEEAAGKKGKS
ncbi:MAG: hypothetical protein E6Q76_18660 [Rhizobium sp.]|nr:MAG: hypothetical protein E6Q76_18660 [Rhizobium sp.]